MYQSKKNPGSWLDRGVLRLRPGHKASQECPQSGLTKILIVGAGNLLLSDEGFGVHLIRYLEENCRLPGNVELFDAGTLGLFALPHIENADVVYLIDSIAADAPPGTLLRLSKDEFINNRIPLKLSPHQAGIQEMLLISEMRGRCPRNVFLWGIIPASLAPGVQLSPELHQQIPPLATMLLCEIMSSDKLSVSSSP